MFHIFCIVLKRAVAALMIYVDILIILINPCVYVHSLHVWTQCDAHFYRLEPIRYSSACSIIQKIQIRTIHPEKWGHLLNLFHASPIISWLLVNFGCEAPTDSSPPPGALPPSSAAPRLRARCAAWPRPGPWAAPGVSGRADLAAADVGGVWWFEGGKVGKWEIHVEFLDMGVPWGFWVVRHGDSGCNNPRRGWSKNLFNVESTIKWG